MEGKDKINIASCPGMCNLAKLTQGSARRIAEEGYGNFVKLYGLRASEVKKTFSDASAYSDRWILIQGCEYECGKKFLAKENIAAEKSFTVASTGIERGIHVEYSEEDQNKVVAAIKEFLD